MADVTTSSQLQRLLDKRLREVADFDKLYKDLNPMIPTLFRMLDSDAAFEEFYSVGSLPDHQRFTGKIPFVNRNPGYHIKIEPYEYALGRQLERKFLDDKKYGVFDDEAVSLINSAGRTMEKEAAGVFTGAFSTAFQYQNNEEGIALCGSHKTKSGTSTASGFSNSGTSAMNKTSVAATRILMRQFRNDVSERIEMSDNFALIVPDALADAAYELVNTPKGMDSAEGNVNPQYKRYKVIPYARLDDSDTNNWFMVNMDLMKKSLVFINRIKPETRTQVDFHTLVTMISSYMRFAVGTTEWRWIYGHNVT